MTTTTGGATRETKADRTRRRILESAASDFAVHGYAGTSLRRIAEGAGLQLGSLYFHFPSKDALLGEVVRDAVAYAEEQVGAALAALAADADPAHRLRTAVEAHLQALHVNNDRGAAVVRIIDVSPELAAVGAHRHVRPYARFWAALVTDAQQVGAIPSALDPVIVRDLLIGAMHATVGTRQLGPERVTVIAATVCDLVLRA